MPLRLDMVRLRSSDPVASHSFYRQAFALNDANATDAADTPLNIHGRGQLHIVPGEETPPASPAFDGYVFGAILQQPTDVDQLLGAAHQQGARMIKMQVEVTNTGPVPVPPLTAKGAVASAVGDPAQLLHIHMHQIAGVFVLVAHRFGLSHPDTGVQIDVPKKRHLVPAQHFRYRRLRQAQVIRDPVRSPPPAHAQSNDPSFGALGRAVR